MRRVFLCLSAALVALAAAGCEDPDRPYVRILGGGFVFNYRVAEVYYGFTVEVVRPVPIGTVLEAEFEDPSGGPPFVLREQAGLHARRYSFRTPPLKDVRADTPYRAELRLLARQTGELMVRYERSYSSQVGMEVLPERPLTVGPGYHRPQHR